ncbi:hypothetical protein D3C85_1494860 [compost metagenome]
MASRIKNLFKFLRGDLIVLSVDSGLVTIDPGNTDKGDMQLAASKFFNRAYNLGKA